MSALDELKELLVNYPRGKYTIETIELSHSQMSKTYYLTREPFGVTAKLETGVTVTFAGTTMSITQQATRDDLEQTFTLVLPDLDNVIDDELARIPYDSDESIVFVYRQYLSDNLEEPALIYTLEVLDVTQAKGRCTLRIGASQLNWFRTGLTYNFTDFPMLLGL